MLSTLCESITGTAKEMTTIRTYRELSRLKTFEERFEYLRMGGRVGEETFGYDRYLNQEFYRSRRWRDARDYVIIRDDAHDFGHEDYEIKGRIIVHHMNPITQEDIENDNPDLYDPEFLVCTSQMSHEAIHYSDVALLPVLPVERRKYDTIPWRKNQNGR